MEQTQQEKTKATNATSGKERGGRGNGRGSRGRRKQHEAPEFDQRLVEVARVTRVMAGGKRMRFRACVVIGDRKGRVGMGVKKGADVSLAVDKAVAQAKKNMITVPMVNDTIPHPVNVKLSGARLLMKPAPQGRGVIAGGPVRVVMELAGIKNVVSKMMGSNNKVSNVRAAIHALASLKTKEYYDALKTPGVQESVKAETTEKVKETTEDS